MDALTMTIDPDVPVESKHVAVKLLNIINRSAEEMDMVKIEKDALLTYYKNRYTKLQECSTVLIVDTLYCKRHLR